MADIKEIKPLKESDLKELHAWMCAEEWTSASLDELKAWRTLYPDSFIGAYNDKGELLGHVFNRCLSEKTALIEMVVMRADTRGKGIGSRLVQHAVQRHPNHNTVLVALNSAEQFYIKQGFKPIGLTFIREYGLKPVVSYKGGSNADNIGIDLVRFNGNDDLVELVRTYDVSVRGQDRGELLKLYANNDGWYCVCAKKPSSDKVVGFIITKKTEVKCKVVALCADSADIATALLRRSFEFYSDPNLSYCVVFPSPNQTNGVGMYGKSLQIFPDKPISDEMFMSTSGPIEDTIDWEKIYSISELGYMSFV